MSNDGWAKVPAQLILSDMPAGALQLYAYLAWRQGENDTAWPSWATIADDLGMHNRTVARHLRRLEDAGWIVCQRDKGAVNHYSVCDKIVTSDRIERRTPDKRAQHEVDPPNKKHTTRRDKKVTPRAGDPRVPDMQRAIAEVCQVDLAISRNWGWLGKEATALLAAGYTADNVRHFLTWWLADDWRATHNPIPSVRVLRERIGQANNGVDSPAGPTDGRVAIDLGCNYG